MIAGAFAELALVLFVALVAVRQVGRARYERHVYRGRRRR